MGCEAGSTAPSIGSRMALSARAIGVHVDSTTLHRETVEALDNGYRPAGEDQGSAAWVATALEAALKARAPGVQASTGLVVRIAFRLGRELGLDAQSQALLEVAARVRDIGMLALPDSVVLATSRLSAADWALINCHPVLGEQLLEELYVVAEASGIVRAHHERWDGGGYPDGLTGDSIPLLSRVIATADAFVAIASDRPHRRGMGAAAAIDLVCQERGSQFDPVMVDGLVSVLARSGSPRLSPADDSGRPVAQAVVARAADPTDLKSTISEFDVVPVLAPAYERLLAAIASDQATGAELVVAIESDIGLTVAVLRSAQALVGRKQITNVPDAVAALGRNGIDGAIRSLPRAEFPWRTSELEVLMHGFLVHAQAVARAADRLAQELDLSVRDDLLVASLLHDIGKLVMGRAYAKYSSTGDLTATPEERIRREQRAWGVDHANLGGLLLRRWGLSGRLADNVATHHRAEADHDIATYVRLADMLAHHAQGHVVDRSRLLSLAHVCGLSTNGLREILFDLPHSGASDRRRAEQSPLSVRQTDVLTSLARGKQYKDIALELGVTASTVRSHLHAVYLALDVDDRAQAVLRATEMGWI
jgi:putative nucleotidyltransferase with HDIG domain